MLSFEAHAMAVDRVQKRLKRATKALEAAGIPYAVIGGNAVAAWVGGVDSGATRATKDVDLLVNLEDNERIARAFEKIGFQRRDLRRMVLFIDPEEPSKRSGVHLVWAGKLIRPSYACPAPTLDESVRSSEGFTVINLAALVRMKLTSFRDIDRVHISDLIGVGLIDSSIRRSLPPPLLKRLDEVETSIEEDE